MKRERSRIFSAMVVCVITVAATAPESARANSIPTKSDVVWIGVAIGAIGAGIGVGIYYAVHHNSSLTGCAVPGPNGLELLNKGDQQTYSLVGAVTAIKPGEQIRVSGKRVKKSSGPAPQFLVEHLSKDYGACAANTVAP